MANRPYAAPVPAAPVTVPERPIPIPNPLDPGHGVIVDIPNPIEVGQEAASAAGSAAAAVGWLLRPDSWVRIAKVVLGGALILVSIQMLITRATLPVAAQVVGVGTKAKAVGTTAGKVLS